MDYDLPTEFDVIVIGTGIVESIVSAAASRVGKQVLHLDNNEYYGGAWASFNLEALNKLATEKVSNVQTVDYFDPKIQEKEWIKPIGNDLFNIEDIELQWYIPENEPEEAKEAEATLPKESGDANPEESGVVEEEGKAALEEDGAETKKTALSQERLLKDSRRFNIDLAPKLHYARGDFVELMISSNIARYSEFRSVSRVLTLLNGKLEVVPCSRSDVFSNEKVSVIEKRLLMKLLSSCLEEEQKEFGGYEKKSFKSFLNDRKLTPDLIHYVLYAISMSDDKTLCMEGVERTKRFLDSLGRFGKTPFLYSMYGSGEIPQAFCRLSAVFGGVYALNQPNTGILLDTHKNFKGIICGKQRINAKHLVIGVDKMPDVFLDKVKKNYISRAVFLTDRSILESEKEHLTLLMVPPESGKDPVTIFEMGNLTGTCPKDTHLVHMFTRKVSNPKEDFKHCVDQLFLLNGQESGDNNKPKVLMSFYFSVPDTNESDLKTDMPSDVFVCPGPDIDLDYDNSIKKAKDIFQAIYPDLEFLPRAPDPEEIIIGEEAEPQEEGESVSEIENAVEGKEEETPQCDNAEEPKE